MWWNESLAFDSNVTTVAADSIAPELEAPGLGARSIVVPVVYSVICLVGIAGNGLVIYLVWRHREMRTVTNYYIVNLAVTDLAFLICCVPFSVAKIVTHSWEFGEFLCKFIFYFMQVTAQATCMTLAVLSLDRFWAIVKPYQTPWFRTPVGVAITTAIIWIGGHDMNKIYNTFLITLGPGPPAGRITLRLSGDAIRGSFLLSLPIAFFMEVSEREWYGRKYFCMEEFPSEDEYRAYIIYTVLISYVIPLTTSVASHCLILRYLATMAANTSVAQQHVMARKKRVTRMVATVVILFAMCWAPNHAANLWWAFKREDLVNGFGPVTMWLKISALCLSYANSCVNPFVYGIMGDSFKKAFAKSFRRGAPNAASSACNTPRTPKNTKEEEFGMVKLGGGETGEDKLTPESADPIGEMNKEEDLL
ncbi:KISS1R [Branchiostoma lanceolatum]|uniref:KISS1R protein n=1 Tax=Branchiostoma lanceolatum TaxID=7740 RepID=A0A8J9VPW6_BRALA|nr:KISS1R [Branchiostoma lanceolatum]